MNSTQIYKTCSKCKTEKPLTDYYKDKGNSCGYRYDCKTCNYKKKVRLNKNGHKTCTKCDVEKPLDMFHKQTEGFLGKKPSCKECCKLYEMENKNTISKKRKEWFTENRSHISEYKKMYRKENKNKIVKWRKENNDKIKLNYIKTRYIHAWRRILKRHLNQINKDKNGLTFDLLLYTPMELKQRMECQFKDGMSWDNYGEWHIDHKKPLSVFNEDAKPNIVNALCNLQPLWAMDNLIKSDKWKYL